MFRKKWLVLLFSLIFIACSTVPITGRKQLSIIPGSQIQAMSFSNYNEFLNNNKVIHSGKDAEMVKRVGKKIQTAVESYFTQKKMSSALKGYAWEFNLVDDPNVNAWCMPGGKVVVYSGILPVTKNEAGLAVVVGHEVAHAVAGHGNERMSQGLMVQFGGMALEKALEQKPEATRQLYMSAFGMGAQLGVMLPYSRLHESEADHLGLIFMAMAGYDPHIAVDFWQRMAANKDGQAPPEFMSTHPADATRIKQIKKLLPKALKYYQK